jgi:hypothetical protein
VAHVRVNPGLDSWITAHVGSNVHKVTEAVARDAIAGCPVDSGDLVSTIRTYYPGKLNGIVIIGGNSRLATDVDYWAYVEYGTAPHWIDSHGDWSLRSDDGRYFGRRVWHPGTRANPFMRRALMQQRRLDRSVIR